jgi:hypothetical protein
VLLVGVSAGASLGATAWRTLYPKQGDRLIFDDLDLTCFEVRSATRGLRVVVPQTLACVNTATGNGPYVRITPTRITVAATNQRTLFTVKRDR